MQLETYKNILILNSAFYNVVTDGFKIRIEKKSKLKECLYLKKYLKENDKLILYINSDTIKDQQFKYILFKYDDYNIIDEKDSLLFEFYINYDEDITRKVKIENILNL